MELDPVENAKKCLKWAEICSFYEMTLRGGRFDDTYMGDFH